ncbi:hypothetical protein ACC754_39175 [Rhizobium johnstonii]
MAAMIKLAEEIEKVCAAIQDAVADRFELRPLGLVQVKGRAEKVDLWEIVGENPKTQE